MESEGVLPATFHQHNARVGLPHYRYRNTCLHKLQGK